MSTRPVKIITNIVRNASTKPVTNNDIKPFIYNRNPRNLEMMRIDRKPMGYPVDDIFVEYWHKLEVLPLSNYVTAQIVHNSGKVVVEASTKEWALYKFLYSKQDTLAYITLGKVFAQRCLESGIYNFASNIVVNERMDNGHSKLRAFINVLEEEGLTLNEMPQFDVYKIWHRKREKRPWTVLEDPDK